MNIRQRINDFDFESAQPHDLAVLFEQIFLHHDSRSRDGGPILVAIGVITRYEESVRQRAAPELHKKVRARHTELREVLVHLETAIRGLEKDNAQTRS